MPCNKINELASEGRDIYDTFLKEMDVPHIIQEHHSPLDIVGGELHETPLNIVKSTEAVAIPGSLSNLSIGDKKTQEIERILESQR